MIKKERRTNLKVYDSFLPIRDQIATARSLNEDLQDFYFDRPLTSVNTQEKFDRAFYRSKAIALCLEESLSTLEKVLDAIDVLDLAAPEESN